MKTIKIIYGIVKILLTLALFAGFVYGIIYGLRGCTSSFIENIVNDLRIFL